MRHDQMPTLRSFFFQDGTVRTPQSPEIPEEALDQLRARLSDEVPGGFWSATRSDVEKNLREALDVSLGDILGWAWNTSRKLREYQDPSKHPPEKVEQLPLLQHAIKSTHRPRIQVVMGDEEIPVAEVALWVDLTLKLEAATLTIKAGEVKEIRGVTCKGIGTLRWESAVLLETPEQEIRFPGRFTLAPPKTTPGDEKAESYPRAIRPPRGSPVSRWALMFALGALIGWALTALIPVSRYNPLVSPGPLEVVPESTASPQAASGIDPAPRPMEVRRLPVEKVVALGTDPDESPDSPNRMTDGDTTTAWQSEHGARFQGKSCSIRLELGTEKKVSGVLIQEGVRPGIGQQYQFHIKRAMVSFSNGKKWPITRDRRDAPLGLVLHPPVTTQWVSIEFQELFPPDRERDQSHLFISELFLFTGEPVAGS